MNWNIFCLKYDKREEWAFEQMSYLLFCAELEIELDYSAIKIKLELKQNL
jgi:hypothetical protein